MRSITPLLFTTHYCAFMTTLVLEYLLEGHKRGYNFTTPTQGFDDDTLRHIWRSAMPRGQGWGSYTGAQSLKCFPLPDGRMALSEVTVTDLRDESGRAGIRRAVIEVLREEACRARLDERLRHYPTIIQERLQAMPTFLQRAKIANYARFRSDPQLVLAYPYDTPYAWQMIEALVIKLVLAPFGPLRGWRQIIPFTTLALDYREESTLVALPQERARKLAGQDKKLSIIDL